MPREYQQHRTIWSEAFGQIPAQWVVFHVDGDKANNTLENLVCLPPRHAHELIAAYAKGEPRRSRNLLLEVYKSSLAQYQQALEWDKKAAQIFKTLGCTASAPTAIRKAVRDGQKTAPKWLRKKKNR